jgi:cytochrome c-type biogenesis protein CcmH/NrfG
VTAAERTRIEERRDRALADLVELDRQVGSREIDPDDAHQLRRRYRAEAADAIAALETLDGAAEEDAVRGSPTRTWVGVALFAAVAIVAVFGIASAVRPRDDGPITGGPDTPPSTVDLSQVTTDEMEEVVAANPDITPMRLALAQRYVEAGDFSSALPHYLYVLERGDDPEALMYVGWMTYLSGDAATGVTLLERSLQVAPGEPLAQWFLANALFRGTGDRTAAIPLLEAVIASGAAPDDIVEEAEAMLAEAESEQ